MKSHLSPMRKRDLDKFNLEEARGWVIDSLAQIEYAIDEYIVNYYSPRHMLEFRGIVLNSSIIDFGGKCKIITNIMRKPNRLVEHIRRLASIRNAFAHARIFEHHDILCYDGQKSVKKTTKIDVMNSSGTLESKDVRVYLLEFNKTLGEVVTLLAKAELNSSPKDGKTVE